LTWPRPRPASPRKSIKAGTVNFFPDSGLSGLLVPNDLRKQRWSCLECHSRAKLGDSFPLLCQNIGRLGGGPGSTGCTGLRNQAARVLRYAKLIESFSLDGPQAHDDVRAPFQPCLRNVHGAARPRPGAATLSGLVSQLLAGLGYPQSSGALLPTGREKRPPRRRHLTRRTQGG
jgi:hypothetical protein